MMKNKRIFLILAIVLLLAITSFLMFSCDDGEDDGENGEAVACEALVLTADKTEIERTGSVKLTVTFNPENANKIFNGSTYDTLDESKIRYYLEESNSYRALDGSGFSTTFTPGKGGSYVVYAEYVTSRYNGLPKIISNKVTIKVHGVKISTAADLQLLNGSADGFELTQDIDLGGAKWTPIAFSGNLDGQGYKICNLVLSDNVDNLGFFGTLSGTVRNVSFTNVTLDVKSDKGKIGVIAGANKGIIDSCTVSGTVSTVAAVHVGGLVGYNESGAAIRKCTNYASVEAAEHVGGVVGSSYGTVESCVNEGEIKGNINVGGIVGYNNGAVNEAVNKGVVTASADRVGGVAGHSVAKMTNCENLADVITAGDYVGGVVGRNEAENFGGENSGNVTGRYYVGGLFGYSSKEVSNLINEATVTGRAYVGGIVGQCTAVISACTNKGDIVSTGVIIEENEERSYFGGLAGYCAGISGGKNTVDINASGTRVGGLAGFCYGNVSSSVNDGAVSGDNSVGGLIGYGCGTFTSSVNNGSVNGGTDVGGIAGYIYSTAKLDGCINNATVIGSGSDVGGIVGFSKGSIEIIASQNTADVTGKSHVGGFLGGANTTATVRGAINNNVITAEHTAGGIAGSGNSISLFDCENYGAVVATGAYVSDNAAKTFVGGLAGYCGSITNCKNTVNISGIANYVGGLAGYCNGSITNSENNGDVVGGANINGGLAGYLLTNITGSVNNGSVTGKDYTGGLAGSISSGKIDGSSNYGKVTGEKYTGGIAGYVNTQIELTYTKNEADVTGKAYTGGFIGHIYSSSISNIRNAVNSNVVSGDTHVGGILGFGSFATLHDCANYGTVNATEAVTENNVSCTYVGGLAGRCYAINNGKNTADIKGIGAYVGGLAGYSGAAVSGSQNDGDISGTAYVGGLCGYIYGNVIEGKNYGGVSGTDNVGGIGGYVNGQRIEKCENHGSISGDALVGGLCGYEHYNNCEITFSKNNGDVVGKTDCGSLMGRVYNGATFRYSQNTARVNGGSAPFVGGRGGTVKGVIVLTIPADLKISEADTVTSELLGIVAKELDSQKALEVTLTLIEGEKVGGNVATYMAVVSDSYGNTDTFYVDVTVYAMS